MTFERMVLLGTDSMGLLRAALAITLQRASFQRGRGMRQCIVDHTVEAWPDEVVLTADEDSRYR